MRHRPQPLEPVEDTLLSLLESVLLIAGEPVALSALAKATGKPPATIANALQSLQMQLARGIRLQLSADHAQLVSAPENIDVVRRFLGTAKPAPLSRSALEALAVIAYRQPSTRAEVEASRGVNSDRAIQTLLARGLIEERGQRDAPGRPIEYETTFAFLEYFGLSSLADLPTVATPPEEWADERDLGMRA